MIDWSVVEAAHRYADLGWPVLPLFTVRNGRCTCGKKDCPNAGKHPIGKLVPHGLLDATTDHAKIEEWFEKTPANVGIVTGMRSKLDVGDVDPRNGGFESLAHVDLPPTRIVETGGGGLHYYYLADRELEQHELAKGIDLKADGGYVVAPPSTHLNGTYSWIDESTPLAPVPPLFRNGKHPKADSTGNIHIEPDSKEHIAQKLSTMHGQGTRHNELISLAGYFANIVPKPVALGILAIWGEHACEPPLDYSEIKEQVDDAYERWYRPDAHAVDYWTAQSLLDADFPPLRWVVERLLPEGLVFLAGRPKRGKSYAALQIAIDVVSGRHSFGQTTTGKVLYLALEDSARRLQTRLQQMRAPRSDDLLIFNRFARLDEGGTQKLVDLIEEHRPILVVIDTFSRAVSSKLDANEIADMTDVLGPLQTLALRYQTCVLLVDHHRKPGDNPGDMIDDIAGSTAKVAVADAILGLYRKSGEQHAILKLTGRDVEERDVALIWDQLRFQWKVEDGTPLTSTERQIIALIKEQGRLEADDIARDIGMSERSIRGVMFNLRERGAITFERVGGKVGHPRYVYTVPQ